MSEAAPQPGGVEEYMYLDVADMSADATYYLIAPCGGRLKRIQAIVDGAIGTADVTVTPSLNGVAVTGGVVTLPTSGSAAGTNADAAPAVPPNVVRGDKISLAVAGGGAGGSPRGHVVVTLKRD